MLGSQQRFSNSMTSLSGANVAGGPYPTAPVGPLQLSHSDPSQMPILRSHSPKPPSPRFHGQPRNPSPPQFQGQQRNPSPPHSMTSRMSSRPVPNPATGFPSFTAGRSFSSEAQLQHIINWQTVISRNLFEDPPTFQSLLIFLLPSIPSPAVNNFVKQILNTPDHIFHLQKCWGLLKRSDREELISFGLPERVGDMRFEIYRLWLMIRLAWRITQALKNAKEGSRIAEVGEWVTYVIETNKIVSPEKFDPIPLQTLACALTYPHPSMSLNSKAKDSVTPLQRTERDKLALEYFEMGFPSNSNPVFLPSSIYAKAHYARLLRRMERVPEAEEIEQSIRLWWVRTGRAMMPKARFTDLVCGEGEVPYDNVILKSIDGFFERRSENGSSVGVEEVDSSSGRDSGVDVGPVSEAPKHVPEQIPEQRQMPQQAPQQRQVPERRYMSEQRQMPEQRQMMGQGQMQGERPVQEQRRVFEQRQMPEQRQVSEQRQTFEQKPLPEPKPMAKPTPQVPPKKSATALPPLQAYTPQFQSQPEPQPQPQPQTRSQPKSLMSSLPPLQAYTPQLQVTPSSTAPPPPSKPYPSPGYQGLTPTLPPHAQKPYPPVPYDYNGSSDSLSSDHGKPKVRNSFGGKFGFLRKERAVS
ncbi:hypothetical protein ABW19_dt0210514 [Dactylella cylindrospora]|nr:hypothetical protein ABW19_dt0210514 [Dactylella cylindrospora]